MTQTDIDDVAWLDVSGDEAPPSPVQVNAECCSRCRWPAQRLFRDRYAEKDAVCAICWTSHNLDTASAHKGALCWLPGLHAADVVNLQRTACIAAIAGNSHAKKQGQRVLRWMLRHKRETERFWDTSRPAEFAAVMSRLHPHDRQAFRQRLVGCHLVLPATVFSDLSLLLPTGMDADILLNNLTLPRL
ncbi:hypothetical protein L460_04925 [Klebsiella pneumoniae BIDMC 24]|nr:hypothetical protein L460_04925 [Klebsiella pneumoniae BIDMC 24]KMB34790.1 hypothetical protein SL56_04953 [Klebsiella pneumoniae]OVG12621.1 hypothetical protein B5L75_06025 [Klebsiella pneumoniae]